MSKKGANLVEVPSSPENKTKKEKKSFGPAHLTTCARVGSGGGKKKAKNRGFPTGEIKRGEEEGFKTNRKYKIFSLRVRVRLGRKEKGERFSERGKRKKKKDFQIFVNFVLKLEKEGGREKGESPLEV